MVDATAVKSSSEEQLFPWMSSAPDGRVDIVFYDRSCDPAGDAPDDPEACGRNVLGDYIAVASTDGKAQALWTGNGGQGMDVFSGRATFGP